MPYKYFLTILLHRLTLNQTVEMHNFLTNVYQEGDVRSALISIIQALHHSKNGIDVVWLYQMAGRSAFQSMTKTKGSTYDVKRRVVPIPS